MKEISKDVDWFIVLLYLNVKYAKPSSTNTDIITAPIAPLIYYLKC